ncbi:protein-tyrosine phosphatase-like protein [Flagelloscypha sp. PMI_526]|nr:protein-tyrosine phosphatase-like protein [Flagelloscypha sp. PMI_526]
MSRFDSLPPNVQEAMCTPFHEILPASPATGALYLGSMAAGIDLDILREGKIQDIVEVLEEPLVSEESDFTIHRVNISDTTTADLKSHLEPSCQFIDSAVKNQRNIIVFCHQGVSRSASVVIAYLISRHGMSFDTALAHCKEKRACVEPNSGFVDVLQEWEVANQK